MPHSKLPVKFSGARFMIVTYASGALVGLLFTAGMLAFDIGRLRSLALADQNAPLVIGLIALAMALTFAGLYAAVSIMLAFSGRERP